MKKAVTFTNRELIEALTNHAHSRGLIGEGQFEIEVNFTDSGAVLTYQPNAPLPIVRPPDSTKLN